MLKTRFSSLCHDILQGNALTTSGEIISIRVGTSVLAMLMLFGMTELPLAKIVKVVAFNPKFTHGLFVLCVLKYTHEMYSSLNFPYCDLYYDYKLSRSPRRK